MTPMDAWKIISADMKRLYCTRDALGMTPCSDDEIKAEVICYNALKAAQKLKELEDDGK